VPIFDGADEIPREQLIHEWRRLTNYKLVRTVIFTSRTELGLRGERVLKLERLQQGDAESLVKRRLSASLLEGGSREKLLSVVHGHPLAINLLADMAQAMDPQQLRKVLEGHLYDLKDAGAAAQRELMGLEYAEEFHYIGPKRARSLAGPETRLLIRFWLLAPLSVAAASG
jgi:hypothetical protein